MDMSMAVMENIGREVIELDVCGHSVGFKRI
jgi:hypothetical protein